MRTANEIAKLLDSPAAVAPLGLNWQRLSNSEKWIAGICGCIAWAAGVGSYFWALIFTPREIS